MGQRLVIDIIIDDEVKANCYMHWEAYTISTLFALRDIIEVIKKYDMVKNNDEVNNIGVLSFSKWSFKEDMEDSLLWAVRIFEKITNLSYHTSVMEHPGLDSSSYEYMKEKFPNLAFHTAIDRNIGIIHVTEDTMENANNWAEGRLTIDLTNRRFSMDVYWWISYDIKDDNWFDEYKEMYDYVGTQEQLLEELPKINIDITDWIPLDKFDDLMTELGINEENCSLVKHQFISNGQIISMIY